MPLIDFIILEITYVPAVVIASFIIGILLNRDIIPLSIRLGGGLEISQKEENIVIDPTNIDQNAWFFKYR